jgi:hypothetical protein
MNFANGGRTWPISDSLNFALVETDALTRDDKIQEYEGRNHPGILFWVSKELVCSESLKYFSQMVEMIGFILNVDENIIEVNHHKFIEKKAEYPIHDSHESAQCVWQFEGHNDPFEKFILRLEGSFSFITRLDANLMISSLQIEFQEDGYTTELI